MERRLAERLGRGDVAAGFGIVFGLADEHVHRLRDAVRYGRLSAAMIEDARLAARMAGPVPGGDQIIQRDASMRFTPPSAANAMSSDDPSDLIEQRTEQLHAQT